MPMGTSSQRLDVLFITHNFPRHEGDFAGRFLERLGRLLAERDVRVGVVVPHAPGASEYEVMSGIPVWRFRYASDENEVLAYRGQAVSPSILGSRGILAHQAFFGAFKRSAATIIKEYSPRVLHAHWWVPGGWVARSILKNQRFIVTSHGTDFRLLEKKVWMRPLAAYVYRRADVVTAVSGWMADSLSNRIPAIKSKIGVAPMPPEDSIFTGQVRENTNPVPLILCVTRHTIQKRNNILIDALVQLRDRRVEFNCRIIGDGGSERGNLEAKIAELDLGGQVVLLPSMPQAELATEYQSADVTVLPAVDEGFGLTLVEAQLCGCAVVGARSGGLTDIISDNETGLLCHPDDHGDLARALREILSKPDLRVRLARAGQDSARTKFSSRAIVDRFIQWYQLG